MKERGWKGVGEGREESKGSGQRAEIGRERGVHEGRVGGMTHEGKGMRE